MKIISGGYIFVRGKQLSEWQESTLLPETMWTPISCTFDLFPPFWALPWAKPTQDDIDRDLRLLMLERKDFGSLRSWFASQLEAGNVGFNPIIISFKHALEFGRRFMPSDPIFKLLGIGLPDKYVNEFLLEFQPAPRQPAPGIYKAIESGTPMEIGGISLGYEPLGYEYDNFGDFHSFICHGLGENYSKEPHYRT